MIRPITSLLVFTAVTIVVAITLGLAMGAMNTYVSIFGVFAGLVAAVITFKTIKVEESSADAPNVVEMVWLIIFALAALRSFFWLLYPYNDEWYILSRDNLGDISLHLNLIQYLAHATPFWPQSSILVHTQLTYPIGMDLLNAILLNLHVPVVKGLIWTGLLGSLATAYCLWKWGRSFTVAALLFTGGLFGFLGFFPWHLPPLEWKNPFLTLFVTQRGWLYALPATLFLLWSWRMRLEKKNTIPEWIEVLFYGSLPLFNAHAFLFLSAVLASQWIFNPDHRRRLFYFVGFSFLPATVCMALVTNFFHQSGGIHFHLGWMQAKGGAVFWICNFGISLPLIAYFCFLLCRKKYSVSASYVTVATILLLFCTIVSFALLQWDHTKLMPSGVIVVPFRDYVMKAIAGMTVTSCLWDYVTGAIFWICNFGISLPLTAYLCFLLYRKKDPVARSYVAAATIVFLLCTFISFAPWEWDNTKLMLIAWLTVTPFLWDYVIRPVPIAWRCVLCVLLFGSGAQSLWEGLNQENGYSLIKRPEVEVTASMIRNIPINDRIACEPTYNHPILLAGRPVIVGYLGHLWSHGLNYQDTWDKLDSLMKGNSDWKESARALELHYLFWGPREAKTYPTSSHPWENCATKLASSEWGTLWDLKPCLKEKSTTKSSLASPAPQPAPSR